MPEGDSYTRTADRIRPLLVDQTIDQIDGVPNVRKRSRHLLGSTVTQVRTQGKHLLVDTSGGLTIHVALGMSGRVRARAGDHSRAVATAGGAVRLTLVTPRGVVMVESAPTVEVERTRVIDASLARLGPDVLASEFDWPAYRERANRAPEDMLVCDFLLDQRVVAGIGNEYKSEILFRERIHPGLPVSGVDAAARDALILRARRLMMPNAHRKGDRNTTGTYGPGVNSWVYGRARKPCRRCRTAIIKGYIGAKHPRITYWCPACQSLPPVEDHHHHPAG